MKHRYLFESAHDILRVPVINLKYLQNPVITARDNFEDFCPRKVWGGCDNFLKSACEDLKVSMTILKQKCHGHFLMYADRVERRTFIQQFTPSEVLHYKLYQGL